VQHDGNVIARLIAARSAGRLDAVIRAVAAPGRVFRMASPNFARGDRGNRSSERAMWARIFSPGRQAQAETFRRRIYFGKTYFVQRRLYS
jgi:hypothetical protein